MGTQMSGSLAGVTAASATSAWAAGTTGSSFPGGKTLILRWNGTAWKRARAPAPGTGSACTGVAATTGSDAWAVGNYVTRAEPFGLPLIERWNGRRWKQVPVPFSFLNAVAAASARNAWAVGSSGGDGLQFPLIVRWAGHAWKKTRIPAVPTGGILSGVTATSAGSAWAVSVNVNQVTLILRWNGRTWTRARTPRAAQGASLYGVTATSKRNAWAVGASKTGKTLILRWNGTTWS